MDLFVLSPEKRTSLQRILKVALAIGLLMLPFAFLPACFSTAVPADQLVDEGVVDLTGRNFSELGSIRLDGGWQFYWQQLVPPNQAFDAAPPDIIDLPSSWNKSKIDDQSLSPFGYATYRLQVRLAAADQLLALAIPEIGTAFQLFIDQHLVASAGQVTTEREGFTAQYSPQVVTFMPTSVNTVITLHVANFAHHWGGVWDNLYLGQPHQIYKMRSYIERRSVFLIGIFFIAGMYSVIQFLFRKKNKLPLYFSLLCFCVAGREFIGLDGHLFLPFSLLLKLDYLSLCFAVIFFLAFVVEAFPQEFRSKLLTITVGVSLLYSVYILLVPVKWFAEVLYIYQTILAAWLVTTPYAIYRAIRNKRYGAKVFLMIMLVVSFSFINDVLYTREYVYTRELYAISMFGLVVFQAFMLMGGFSNTLLKNETLVKTLAKKNKQLVSISKKLEYMVNERTEALAAANKKLSTLASTDYLTGLLNRRGLMSSLDHLCYEANKKLVCASSTLSVIMIDVDHFKRINDTYGHKKGDEILVWLANTISQTIREQDVIARWGGEEFLVLLPNTDTRGATKVAQHIKSHLADDVASRSVSHFAVTVTMGIAEFAADDRIDEALSRVDHALYQGKDQGRDCIVVAAS